MSGELAQATYSTSIPSTPAPTSDEGILNLYRARKKEVIDYHQPHFSKVQALYDLTRGIYKGSNALYRNNVSVPMLFSALWTDTAKKALATLGGSTVVQFIASSPEAAGISKRNEVLINQQFMDSDLFRKGVDFYGSSFIYGTGIWRAGWTNIQRLKYLRERQLDVEVKRVVPFTVFDGPDIMVVDILDFWPQPGKKYIKDMTYCMHRYYEDLDNLIDAAQGDFPIFSARKLAQLKSTPMSSADRDTFLERQTAWRNFNEYTAIMNQKYAKPVELVDMVGLVPREFAPDGVRMRIITIANGRIVLRNDPFPFDHMRLDRMFLSYSPLPDLHSFHGVGKAEIGAKLQAAGNRIVNQKLDALDQFTDPVFLANSQLGLTSQNLYMKPGRIFLADGPVDDSQFRPLIPNLSGITFANAELEVISRYMQQGLGIMEDTMMGLQASKSQTAREYLGRTEAGMGRIMLEARLAETGAIEPLALTFRDLNRQYLPIPKMIQRIGSFAVIDPSTGLPIIDPPQYVDYEDINAELTCRAVGASQTIAKTQRLSNLMLVANWASANPVLATSLNWIAFFREISMAADLDPGALMMQQIPAINAIANQSGGEDAMLGADPLMGAMGGAGGQGLDELSPSLLGQQTADTPLPVGP